MLVPVIVLDCQKVKVVDSIAICWQMIAIWKKLVMSNWPLTYMLHTANDSRLFLQYLTNEMYDLVTVIL